MDWFAIPMTNFSYISCFEGEKLPIVINMYCLEAWGLRNHLNCLFNGNFDRKLSDMIFMAYA